MTRIWRRVAVRIVGVIATTAMIGATGIRALAAEPQPLLLTMEFTPHGFHAPFYLAEQKGWFKDAGIALTIHDGKGTASTLNLVGAGQSDVGFTSLGALAIARSKGVPVRAIASILHRNIYGLILRKGSGLAQPADFRGKEVLYNTSSIEAPAFAGFLATAGMSLTDVQMLGVDSSAKVSSVLSGKGDAAVGPVPYYLGLLEVKQEIDTVLFADHGERMLDFGLATNDDTIQGKPALLKSFVAVVSRAYEYTLDGHLEEAVDAEVALRADARLDHQTAVNMFKSHALFIPSPTSQGKPTGYISVVDWDDTVTTLKTLRLISDDAKAADMFTTAFSPQ